MQHGVVSLIVYIGLNIQPRVIVSRRLCSLWYLKAFYDIPTSPCQNSKKLFECKDQYRVQKRSECHCGVVELPATSATLYRDGCLWLHHPLPLSEYSYSAHSSRPAHSNWSLTINHPSDLFDHCAHGDLPLVSVRVPSAPTP